jgi:hypothetical protein
VHLVIKMENVVLQNKKLMIQIAYFFFSLTLITPTLITPFLSTYCVAMSAFETPQCRTKRNRGDFEADVLTFEFKKQSDPSSNDPQANIDTGNIKPAYTPHGATPPTSALTLSPDPNATCSASRRHSNKRYKITKCKPQHLLQQFIEVA